MTAQPIKIHGYTHDPDGSDPIPALDGFLHYGYNQNDTPNGVIPQWINIEVTQDVAVLPAGAPPFGVFITGSEPPGSHPNDAIVFEVDTTSGGLIRLSNNSHRSGIEIENNGDLTGTGHDGITIDNNASADSGHLGVEISNNGTGDMEISNNGGHFFIFASGLMEIEGGDGIQLDPDAGYLVILDLPTSNPGGSQRVWNNGGVLNIT